MSVAKSESTSLPKSKGRWWWAFSLLACLVIFGMLQFWLRNAKQVAEQDLAKATARLEAHQAIVSHMQDMQQQVSQTNTALRSDQRGLDRAFGSFSNPEMVTRLKTEFAESATEGVVVATNSSRAFNWGRSQFIYSPDSTQELVVYVKEIVDSKNQPDRGRYSQTVSDPDQVFRIPVNGSKLIDFACAVEKTKTGCQLLVELEGHDPQMMTFEGFRIGGSFSSGQTPHGLHDPGVFQTDDYTFVRKSYERRLWLTIGRRGFILSHQKNGTSKRIYLVIGMKSDRPFRISAADEYKVQEALDIEWDPEQGNFKPTLKLDAETDSAPAQ